jgi:hypothetical protein
MAGLLWMHKVVCGLHGHDNLLQFERGRVFLKCTSCGHESPGWNVSQTRPKVHLNGDIRRFALTPLPDVQRGW